MTEKPQCNLLLVSVIIPCYNHSLYLPEAIESIQKQTYPNIEIIVIDDGSTDNTEAVTTKYHQVKYIYQKNQGLSAARNTGIKIANGDFLVFLDADDLLYSKAISYNVEILKQNSEIAFVSGAYDLVTIDKKIFDEGKISVLSDHYARLLKENYIGMHGTVMYRKWVFKEILYDENLKACEDYDMYLKVARKHPVLHHTEKLAAYRIHGTNMSGNIPLMLFQALEVLKRQEHTLQSDEERKAYQEGLTTYKEYYSNMLYFNLRTKRTNPSSEAMNVLWKFKPRYYFRYRLTQILVKDLSIKEKAPAFSLRFLHRLGLLNNYKPKVGKAESGGFNRLTPFSENFGYDRGGPVDRYYIENFLQTEAASIRGRVLEIGDNNYTMRFGDKYDLQSDILHVDDSNPSATIIGDLSSAPHIPENNFDCIILTQTLQFIYDFKAAIHTCFRILKPGGTLLLTVPGITPIDHGEWEKTWFWSFTGQVMNKILAEAFPPNHIEINTFGNVFVATSFLYGRGLPELKKEELDYKDSHFQVIITAKVVKPA